MTPVSILATIDQNERELILDMPLPIAGEVHPLAAASKASLAIPAFWPAILLGPDLTPTISWR